MISSAFSSNICLSFEKAKDIIQMRKKNNHKVILFGELYFFFNRSQK